MFTVTVRVASYVEIFEDGRQEAVEKHDVVFQIDIAGGLTFDKFHHVLAEHIQMGPGQVVQLSALDKNFMTLEPINCGEELIMHFVGSHRDFENKASFMLGDVVTLERPNTKKSGKKRAPKKPPAPKKPGAPKKAPAPKKPAAHNKTINQTDPNSLDCSATSMSHSLFMRWGEQWVVNTVLMMQNSLPLKMRCSPLCSQKLVVK